MNSYDLNVLILHCSKILQKYFSNCEFLIQKLEIFSKPVFTHLTQISFPFPCIKLFIRNVYTQNMDLNVGVGTLHPKIVLSECRYNYTYTLHPYLGLGVYISTIFYIVKNIKKNGFTILHSPKRNYIKL